MTRDLYGEALKAWPQHNMGTVATPPQEFITAYILTAMAKQIAELEERVDDLEAEQ